jgi:cobalt-zinc-cadmium efflux system outer membrane protein
LGGLEAGYERETEADGARLQGPELVIALPLFQQGQAQRWRSRAEAGMARDQAEALDLAIAHAVRGGVERVARRRQALDEMRAALLPALDAVVLGERQRHDFMLGGVFELVEARRAQLDGYRRWLDALADYGLARLDLARAVGAPLPSEAGPRLALDAPPGGPPAAAPDAAPDPHAHHRMPPAEAADPHAHHRAPAATADPHAHHRAAPPEAPPASDDADAHDHHDHHDHQHQESPR